MLTITCRDFGNRVSAIRRGRQLRQADVARQAGVSRQWLIDLEHGKPTVELGLALHTLATMGMRIDMKLIDPPPSWTLEITRQAEIKAWNIKGRQKRRRAERREAARMKRLAVGEGSVESVGPGEGSGAPTVHLTSNL